MSELGKKRNILNEKENISKDHKTDTTELKSDLSGEEQFIEISKKLQEGNQESEVARKNSELIRKIEENVKKSGISLKIVKIGENNELIRGGSSDMKELSEERNDFREETPKNAIEDLKSLGQDHVGGPQTEKVYPPTTLDGNKAKPSEVSNQEGSESFSRDDSSGGKSEELKKEIEQKTVEEKSGELSDIIKNLENKDFFPYIKESIGKFAILFDMKLQEILKEYNTNSKKNIFANFGTKLTKSFQSFIKNHENLTGSQRRNLLNKVEQINKNNVIRNLTINLIKNKDIETAANISRIMINTGYYLKSPTIRRYAKKEFLQEELEKRFPKNRGNFSKKILEFFDRHKIPHKDSRKKWDWFNKETASLYLREVVYPDVKEKIKRKLSESDLAEKLKNELKALNDGFAPTLEQMRKYGHGDFLSACNHRFKDEKYTTNDIVRKARLRINCDIGKWEGYDKKQFAEYLINLLDGGLRERLGLTDNEGPTYDQLSEIGDGFQQAYESKGFTHNDILRETNLKLNLDYGKWKRRVDELLHDGYKDKLSAFGKVLLDILDDGLKEELGLADNEGPTYDQIAKGYRGFQTAYVSKGFTHNDILRAAKLKIKHDWGKWKGLDREKAKDYLSNLLNSGLREELGLADDEGPTIKQLIDSGHQDFVRAYVKIMKHNELLKELKLKYNVCILPEFASSPQVDIKGLKLPINLEQHMNNIIKLIQEEKEIPREIINIINNHSHDFTRISSFKITGVNSKEKVTFVKSLFEKNLIKEYDKNFILSKLSNSKNFNQNDLLKSGETVSHEVVLPYILNNDKDSIGIEIPIWIKCQTSLLMGHIDIIRVHKNGTIRVEDYKPREFFHSLPQVCIYGLVLKKMCNIKKLKCVVFNQDGAWEFEPESLLDEIIKYLNSKNLDYDWNLFTTYLKN